MNILITHGDVDGVISAVVVTKNINIDKIIFSAPYKLSTDLGDIIENNDIKELYITDLACIDFSGKNLLKLLGMSGVKVYFFDHHKYSIDVSNVVYKYVFNEKKSCAKIVYEYFKENDEHISKLVEIAECSEGFIKDTELRNETDILDLSLRYIVNDDEFRKKIVKELMTKLPSEIEEIQERYKMYYKKFNETIKLIKERVIYNENKKFISMLTDVDTKSAFGCIGKVTSEIIRDRKLNIEFAATIFRPNIYEYVISMRCSKRSNINIGLIIEEIKKEFGGKGGGHKCAGAVAVNTSVIDKVIEKLKNIKV